MHPPNFFDTAVAQWIRARLCEGRGHRFESCQLYQILSAQFAFSLREMEMTERIRKLDAGGRPIAWITRDHVSAQAVGCECHK